MTYWLVLFEENRMSQGKGAIKEQITRARYEYSLSLDQFTIDIPGDGSYTTLNKRFFSILEKAAFIVCDVVKNRPL